MVSDLPKFILKDERQFFIDKVKAPLMKALVLLANRYPEPTFENVRSPNYHVWLRVWDRFFEMEDNPMREALFRAIRRIWISESHDPYFVDRKQVILELWLEEVLEGNWKPRAEGYPQDCWKNDERGKGYEFLKRCYEEGGHASNDEKT